MASVSSPLHPLPAAAAPERADARRNRLRVLKAAARLLAEDPQGTTMEDIARAAGVGKGTLYRRYPDKSAIAGALLDEHERQLQDRLISGPPPLGPGAPPGERLAAFYVAYVDFLEAFGHLSRAIETTEQRLATGAHRSWRVHVAALVQAAEERGDTDADVLAEQLLAPLAPDLYAFQRARLGRSPQQIVRALTWLAHSTLR
jgi:AcrR family transcriptional regulator